MFVSFSILTSLHSLLRCSPASFSRLASVSRRKWSSQKPLTMRLMHFHCGPDDLLGELIDFHLWALCVSAVTTFKDTHVLSCIRQRPAAY